MTNEQVIKAGKALHEARGRQNIAQLKLTEAQEKLDAVLERSKTGRAAKTMVAEATELRKQENKATKAAETRFKNLALEAAEHRLKSNPDDRLKDFHYATTATPITVYEPPTDQDGLAMFIQYLFEKDLTHLIQFSGKVEVNVEDGKTKEIDFDKWLAQKDAIGELPPGVDKRKSARLTIRGYEKWEEAQNNVMTDLTELQAIQELLQTK